MTHSKQLGSKLLSLLLAFAMILALMPAVSLTASAEDKAVYTLNKNEHKFGDGWTWNGQTLHFFGAGTFDVDSLYFSIASTNDGGVAVIDIAGPLTVNFKSSSTFIDSACPLDIMGAGKVAAEFAGSYSCKLFSAGAKPITYAGGAIFCEGTNVMLEIFECSDLTITKGSIDVDNDYSFFQADSCLIKDSSVVIGKIYANTPDKPINIALDKSYLSLKSVIADKGGVESHYTLNKSVLYSEATSDMVVSSASNRAAIFDEVEASVIYFPRLTDTGTLLNISGNDALRALDHNGSTPVEIGGIVFCNEVINAENNSITDNLNGAFISAPYINTGYTLERCSLSGGVLISCKGRVDTYNVTAEDATIVILSTCETNDATRAGFAAHYDNDTFKSCTIVNRGGVIQNANLNLGESNVENCYVYTNTFGQLTTSKNQSVYDKAQPNNYYAPNGTVMVNNNGYTSGSLYTNITCREIILGYTKTPSPIMCGDVCADFYETYNMKFDGSDKYDVSIGGTVIKGSMFVNNTAHAYEKKSGGTWKYLSIPDEYEIVNGTSLYIGKQFLNSLKDPTVTYSDVQVSKKYPASMDIELALPYEDHIAATEFKLFKDGAAVDPADAGIIPEVTGSGTTLTLKLSAGENITEGSYTFSFSVNGQMIKGSSGTDMIGVNLSEYPMTSMEFSDIANWLYTDDKGNIQTFSDVTATVHGDKWTWYGTAGDGYNANTLVLEDGFSFTTGNICGINFDVSDPTVIVKGNASITCSPSASAGIGLSINSTESLTIKCSTKQSALNVNAGIRSVGKLTIKGVDVNAAADTAIGENMNLLDSKTIFLNNTKITAGDNWKDKCVIFAPNKFTISRGVTLDLPASNISAGSTYIAHLDSVDNIKAGDTILDAAGSPYGSDRRFGSLNPVDSSKGMKLATKAFRLTDDISDLVIEDTAVFGEGSEKLLGGQEYKFDISGYIGINDFNVTAVDNQNIEFSVKLDVNGVPYLVADVPNTATSSTITPTITFTDSKFDYSSGESVSFQLTVGSVVKSDRLGFYCEGSYDISKRCYITSAAYNGRPLELQGTYSDEYYLVPSGEEIEVTLVPDDGYRFSAVKLGEWKYDGVLLEQYGLSQSGTYTVKTSGIDNKLFMDINTTTVQQYSTVDLEESLRQDLSDGKILSVTLIYSDGSERIADSKNNDFPVNALNNNPVRISIGVPTDSNGEPLTVVDRINNLIATYDSEAHKYISGYVRITKDSTFITVEYGKVSPGNATVTVNCGENGTVSPTTAEYPIDTEVTLTVTPDEGYRVKSAMLDGKEVMLTDGKYTFVLTADCEFSVEFEKIPASSATVTVNCGENGTVSPSTADYPIGTEVTLTVSPDNGYEVKSVTLDGKAVKLTNGKYTFTLTADCVFSAEFQKKSTGGNTSGGHYSGGSGSTGTTESKPALNGESKSWSDIASDIAKSGENDTMIIDTNGETDLTADVIKAIKDSGAKVTVKIDASKSWTIDGSDIKDGASSADLSLLPGTSTAKGARGSAGYRFTTGGNDLGADLNIEFKPEYAGKFANLYFIKDGKAEFVSTAKVAENGSVTLSGADSKGEYVVMLSDYSDLPGDVNNDGKVLISDALAALCHCVDIEQAANPEMLDFNGDGQVTIADALAILRYSVGLSY